MNQKQLKSIFEMTPRIFFLLLISFTTNSYHSQTIEKIKFGRKPGSFVFFQKGLKSDTVIKNTTDLFYLLVPDSMKPDFSLSVENGRFMKSGNDSLLRLEYLPGLKYETFYVVTESKQYPVSGGEEKKGVASQVRIKTLINGTTDKEKNVILIRITNKAEDTTLLENTFYFREEK